MSRSSYSLAIKRTVGDYQVCTLRYWPEGPHLKTQTEIWNGDLLAKDGALLGSASSRRRLLKDAGTRHAITEGDRLALDSELARLGSAVETDYAQRQRARRPQDASAQDPVCDGNDVGDDPPLDDGAPAEEERGRDSQATQLVQLAASWGLFHDADGTPYATAVIEGTRQTYRLHGAAARRLLSHAYFRQYEKAPRAQAMGDALSVLAGRALFDGPEQPIAVRLAEHDGAIWLDLGDASWRAVQITPAGWRIAESGDVPIRFIRAKGRQALPAPRRGGSIAQLRAFLNVKDDAAWYLIVGWLLAALRPTGPYPVLVLTGQQGAGKSTAGQLLRALVDPNKAPLRGEPRDERDLAIAASNGWVVAFDNLSLLRDWLSDAICRLSTGGGFSARTLYENDDETLFDYQRPCMLTSIEDVITRGDLLDRVVLVELEPIADGQRRPERDLWAAFTAARPAILGALLDVLAGTLAALPATRLERLPRMADFALWATAAEGALGWPAGSFMRAYGDNRADANELALTAAIILPPLRALLPTSLDGTWQGSASDLLTALTNLVDEVTRKQRAWPKQPNVLSGMLKRIAPNLQATGITYWKTKGPASHRVWIHHFGIKPTDAEGTGKRSHTSHTPAPPPEEADAESVCDAPSDHRTPSTEDRTPAGPIAHPQEPLSREEPSTMCGVCDVCDLSRPPSTPAPTDASYTLIADRTEFCAVLTAIAAAPVLGLDTETTGLDPHRDRLRLLTLSTSDHTYIVDTWRCADWQELVRPLFADARKTLVAHNARFDLRFLLAAGIAVDAVVHDTLVQAQLIDGGASYDLREDGTTGTRRSYGLAAVVERSLGHRLDKEQQTSDWGRPALGAAQLAYAARDAAILPPLYAHQRAAIEAGGLARVAAIEAGCTPALAWLEHAGMPFDAAAWQRLSDAAVREEGRLRREIMARFGAAGANQFGGFRLKLESPRQLRAALGKIGVAVADTDEATLQAVRERHPVVPLVLDWRDASKRVSVYGIEFIAKHLHPVTGRIHGDYQQLGSAAGRMSCVKPNLQNIPRTPAYRACFRAPAGRALVKCDYSQIEVRLIAAIAGDHAMLDAYRTGADLYKRTAAAVLGVPEDQVTKDQRQLAKVLVLGLQYGMGAQTLAQHAAGYGVSLSPDEARHYRDRFFATYTGLRRWHQAQPRETITTRTLAGRARVGVETFMQKVNSPVQGSGADGLKLALGRLWAHRHEAPTARLVATVHDEIVAECPAGDAPAVAAWLARHMEVAMGEIADGAVPIVVEATIARDWAGTPLEQEGAPW